MKQYPLKFRVWDITSEKFIKNSSLCIADEGKTVMWDFSYTDYTEQRKVPSEAVIQLFTGLFDRNGKEIFEGDIVEIQSWRHYDNNEKFGQKIDNNPMNTAIGFITFDRGSFKLNVNGNLDYVWHDIWNENKKGNIGYSVEPTVIGNIFENPKLLKTA